MADYNIYEDISKRSGGELFIGVVGPARTGKSTLIKKFMAELVLPYVEDQNLRAEMTDEMPQSASGKTIMTTEPKFIPGKAVEVKIESARAMVRFCDCVGFLADGVQGAEEEGAPRLVKTPWSKQSLPFAEAAALGTEKVISEHSTIALCVTTDGSFGDIPRQSFISAEERTVSAVKKTGKPFVLILNSAHPFARETQALKAQLQEKYACAVEAVNGETLGQEALLSILKSVLFEFPVTSFDVDIPAWMQALPPESSAISELISHVRDCACHVQKMKDHTALDVALKDCKYWAEDVGMELSLSTGTITLVAKAREGVFFELLSEAAGATIQDERSLMQYVACTAEAKRNYDKVKDAFECARVNGYGIVSPDEAEMELAAPRMVKKGGTVGIKLRASAPSYHIVKVDIHGEVSPIMGGGVQNEKLVGTMMQGFETSPEEMWRSNLFGRSLKDMVREGLDGKVGCMPEETKGKMRRAISKIVNDGRGNILCIIL